MTRRLSWLCAALLLAACNVQPVPPSPSTVSFRQLPSIRLDVGKITIVEEYKAPLQAPNVEHLFAVTPTQGIRRWTEDRLRAHGGENILEVTIREASVVEAKLPRTDGLKGLFTRDQAERYDGHLTMELRIYKPGELMSQANATADVTQSRTIGENASLATRENVGSPGTELEFAL